MALEARLQRLLALEENKKCADCGTRQPRWASYSLGVFICLQCAGFHRSLGVHHSRVKSCDLDRWTVDQVVAMESMGNGRGQTEYGTSYAAVNNTKCIPDARVLEEFIHSKYVRRVYARRPPLETFSSTTTSTDGIGRVTVAWPRLPQGQGTTSQKAPSLIDFTPSDPSPPLPSIQSVFAPSEMNTMSVVRATNLDGTTSMMNNGAADPYRKMNDQSHDDFGDFISARSSTTSDFFEAPPPLPPRDYDPFAAAPVASKAAADPTSLFPAPVQVPATTPALNSMFPAPVQDPATTPAPTLFPALVQVPATAPALTSMFPAPVQDPATTRAATLFPAPIQVPATTPAPSLNIDLFGDPVPDPVVRPSVAASNPLDDLFGTAPRVVNTAPAPAFTIPKPPLGANNVPVASKTKLGELPGDLFGSTNKPVASKTTAIDTDALAGLFTDSCSTSAGMTMAPLSNSANTVTRPLAPSSTVPIPSVTSSGPMMSNEEILALFGPKTPTGPATMNLTAQNTAFNPFGVNGSSWA